MVSRGKRIWHPQSGAWSPRNLHRPRSIPAQQWVATPIRLRVVPHAGRTLPPNRALKSSILSKLAVERVNCHAHDVAIFNKKGSPATLAQLTWDRGDHYFAPALRGSAGVLVVASFPDEWQQALAEICEVGWALHTWTVVADAPGSYIATPLFTRPE